MGRQGLPALAAWSFLKGAKEVRRVLVAGAEKRAECAEEHSQGEIQIPSRCDLGCHRLPEFNYFTLSKLIWCD